MSFTVNLYRFSKKENSTARPGSEPASFPCRLREPSGILNPSIMLDLGLVSDPSGYNYAYIPEYGRYYWINEWTFERACWTASMSVDVLATWKDYIGSESLYVLRSSAAYDGRVMDRHYPVLSGVTYSRKTQPSPWSAVMDTGNITNGSFVVGVTGKSGNYGSIQYYALSASDFSVFTRNLMLDFVTEGNGYSIADGALALQKSIIDPFEYIKSVVWVPFDATTASGTGLTQSIIVFDYSINASGHPFGLGSPGVITGTVEWPYIDRHPQAASRGEFCNLEPFTEAELYFPPFGIIKLDTRLLAQTPALTARWNFDCITGACILEVLIGGSITNRLSAQVGVPIQISRLKQDVIGVISGYSGALGNAFTGNILGAAAGIGSALESAIPHNSTIGSAGGWGDLIGIPELNQYFYPIADEDIWHHGRPLCQNRVISSIPGYILVQDGDVSIPGTIDENTSVKAYLEGGFFYE